MGQSKSKNRSNDFISTLEKKREKRIEKLKQKGHTCLIKSGPATLIWCGREDKCDESGVLETSFETH